MMYVIKEIRRHYWRTIFSIAGYAVATIFIMIILSISNTNKKDSLGILRSTGTHFIVYIPTSESCCSNCTASGTIIAEGVKTMMMDNEMIRTIKDVKGVRDAAPCLLYRMYNESFASDITLSGIDTTSIATGTNVCARTNLIAGKFLSDNPDELVAEQSFAIANKLKLGDTLDIFGGRMVLAGIVNSGIKPVKADFYSPIQFVRNILKDKLQCTAPYFDMNIILVEVSDSRLQEEVMSRIRNMMYKFAVSSYNCYEPASSVMGIIDTSSLGLTIIIFIFLVIFSAKTQLTALIERFREIGILKSLGWSDFDLSIQIFLVAVIQAIIGVTVGILASLGAIEVLRSLDVQLFSQIEFRLSFSVIPVLYALSLAGALASSIFPVIKLHQSDAGNIIKNYL